MINTSHLTGRLCGWPEIEIRLQIISCIGRLLQVNLQGLLQKSFFTLSYVCMLAKILVPIIRLILRNINIKPLIAHDIV